MTDKLEKAFSSKDVFAMAFGTMVGWTWIMLSGIWAVDAGMLGAVGAFAIGTVMCVAVGMVYAELTPAFPYTGGSVIYSLRGMGYWPAVVTGLAASFAYIGIAALEGPAFSTAIDYIIPIPRIGYLWTIGGYDVYLTWALTGVVIGVVITWINIKGVTLAAIFERLANVGKIGVGVVFAIGCLFTGDTDYVQPLFTDGHGFFLTLVMVPAMFVGFDVIPQSAGEMNVPLKRIPRLLVISITAAGIWYMLMIVCTCVAAPLDVRTSGPIPVADSMAFAFGSRIWGNICVMGAICGIVTCWNGFLFAAARCLYAMADEGMLPRILCRLHPKYKTPYAAVILCGVISVVSCFLGTDAISWFVNSSSMGTVLLYGMTVASLVALRKKCPDLERPYKLRHYKTVVVISGITVLFFAYLYTPMGPSALNGIEWIFVVIWFIIGISFALWQKRRGRNKEN